MPPITPLPSTVPAAPAAPARNAEAIAAQRAFFAAALGKAAPAVATTASATAAPVVATPASVTRSQQTLERVDIPDEPPSRILRPGSLLDIKV
jgi:hypothetical protein